MSDNGFALVDSIPFCWVNFSCFEINFHKREIIKAMKYSFYLIQKLKLNPLNLNT